jgi:hypothetical protein
MKRLLIVLLLAAGCVGCETVVFQAPPVAAQSCDPALVGRWLSVGDQPGEHGEVELKITADCTLWFVEHEKNGIDQGEPTTLHVGRDGRIAYAWVDARWTEKRMQDSPDRWKGGTGSGINEGDLVLLKYRASGRSLEFRMADAKAFAHRVIDGKIKGTVDSDEDEIAVRVTAPVDPRTLRDGKLFPRGEMHFERSTSNE